MIALKHNCPQIRNKVERIKKLVDGGWQEDSVRMMDRARKRVKMLTPFSKGTGSMTRGRGKKRKSSHVRDGWKLHVIGRGGKDRVPVLTVVYNRLTHDAAGRPKRGALLTDAAGMTKGYTLLDILEYGSRAHIIRPKGFGRWKKTGRGWTAVGGGAQFLHFQTREGHEVFTKRVSHPGTKPHGMVRIVRAKLARWAMALNRKWKKKIEGEWGK